MAPDDPRLMAAARATGADVPVCLDPRPRFMRGIGEILSDPLDLPRLAAVLVNPGVAVPTKDAFAALRFERTRNAVAPSLSWPVGGQQRAALLAALADDRNDLEAPAIKLAPVIADVLGELRRTSGCRLARMSGSGATCFALFDTRRAATAGAQALRVRQPAWWVRPTALASPDMRKHAPK
jgi:4-diphosphocytidyl-2-C-methyl-D-erythritol kinase